MNDSFLEDLELVSKVKTVSPYRVDRNITTRTSTPLQRLSQSKEENVLDESTPKESKKVCDQSTKKQMRVRISERKEKPIDTKLKPIENKVNVDAKEQDIKDDIKSKIKESRLKISESKVVTKERIRRSGSYKENTQAPDTCVKENSRPTDCSKETTSQTEIAKDKTKAYDSLKKVDSKEALLNDIKEIVNICTKQENAKILRAMQELHLNSQATLIKQLLSQTDDIIGEMHPSKDSNRVKYLVEQNERLKEDIVILQRQNNELQKKFEDYEYLKQENFALKLKCKELSKQ